MLLTNSISPKRFLAEYWQRRSLFLKSALGSDLPYLESDELAWLATQAGVECGLIFTDRSKPAVAYRYESGPFSEAYLNELPNKNWTLLVHDVDKHLPDFKVWFRQAPFIPHWRIDDLMVSLAAPGGGVGPHKDNYDVFLCQGFGRREWRLSDDATIPMDNQENTLRLLQPFDAIRTYESNPNDVLYLPPGEAHWGIAKELCTTYSIGMRAPTLGELQASAERLNIASDGEAITEVSKPNDAFYADPDLDANEANTYQLSPRAIERLREQRLVNASLTDAHVASVLGSAVTDPKPWLDPDIPTSEEVERALTSSSLLLIHGMARMAWYAEKDRWLVFINGHSTTTSAECAAAFFQIVETCKAQPKQIQILMDMAGGDDFFRWACAAGAFDIEFTLE